MSYYYILDYVRKLTIEVLCRTSILIMILNVHSYILFVPGILFKNNNESFEKNVIL